MAVMLKTDRTLRFDTSNPTTAATTDTLAAAVTSTSQTSITLTSGAATVNGTFITIGSEQMLIVSGGGTANLTVTRGSSPSTYSNGASVSVPGHNVFTLQAISGIPNQEVIGQKFSSDFNFVLVQCGGSDSFPGGGTSLILPDNSSSRGTFHLKAPGAGTVWIQLGGVGAAGPAGAGATPAGDVTLGTPQLFYDPPDQQGKIKAKITVPFTPPVTLGTWDHVYAYLVAPDDAATVSKAVVQAPVGNTGFFIGPAGTGSNIVPNFTPLQFGPFHASENMLVVEYPAPAATQTWRVYAVSGSTQVENTLVPYGAAGASPSVTISVPPAPATILGAEYAPNAIGLTGALYTRTNDAGSYEWSFSISWSNPTSDPRYPQLGGYDVAIQGSDGVTINPLASPSRTDTSYQSDWFPFGAGGPYVYVIRLIAWDVNSRKNTIVSGVTPAVSIAVQKPAGGTGEEYTTLVASFTATVSYGRAADGTEQWWVTLAWVNPSDNTFGGIVPTLIWNGTTAQVPLAVTGPADTTIKCGPFPMGAANTAVIYALSFDRSNRNNTLAVGTTPQASISVSPQGPGLSGAKMDPATLAATLAINAALLGVAPHSISDTQVTPAGISTPSLTTNEIAIGGGGSKPIRFRVYDHSGSAIAWIGDDTLNSGYVGAWFQQLYVGGTGPAGAPFSVNASGQLSIVMTSANAGATPFSLALNNAITSITNSVDSLTSDTSGLKVQDVSSNFYSSVQRFGVYVVGYNLPFNPGGYYSIASLIVAGTGSMATGNLDLHSGDGTGTISLRGRNMQLLMNGNQVVGARKTDPGAPSFATISDAQTWCTNLRNALAAATGGHGLF